MTTSSKELLLQCQKALEVEMADKQRLEREVDRLARLVVLDNDELLEGEFGAFARLHAERLRISYYLVLERLHRLSFSLAMEAVSDG